MSTNFLSAVHQGKNDGWRYLVSLCLILFFWLILGAMPFLIWALANHQELGATPTDATDQLWQFSLLMISFCLFLLGIFLAVKLIHQRRFRSLVRADAQIRFRRIVQGAALWAALIALPYCIEALIFPTRFALTFKPSTWLILLPIAFLLIPIQSATEELFFRGYLLQSLSLFTRNAWVLIIITSVIFAGLHLGNPEVEASNHFGWIALNYLAFGIFLAAITLKDDSLELAIGAHAANNLFLALIVSPKVSVLGTPAILTQTFVANAKYEFFLFLIQAGIFYSIFWGKFRIQRRP